MILTGAIRLQLWTIDSECAESRVLRIRMCQKLETRCESQGRTQRTRTRMHLLPASTCCFAHPKKLFISASCLLTWKGLINIDDDAHAVTSLTLVIKQSLETLIKLLYTSILPIYFPRLVKSSISSHNRFHYICKNQ